MNVSNNWLVGVPCWVIPLNKILKSYVAQSAEAVEYTNCISVEG